MIVHQCDACGFTTDNPYKVEMKEFYIGSELFVGSIIPSLYKRKVKIDLCPDCFKGLKNIAERVVNKEACCSNVV